MNRISFFILFLLIFNTIDLTAQTIEKYSWELMGTDVKLSEDEEKLPEVILKHHQIYDYVIENNSFVMYKTEHFKVLANNASAIENHNKIYIALREVIGIEELKARTISPTGKIVELDENNIKELKDEDGKGYKIFAIEGAEEGGIIEYFYTLKSEADFFGRVTKQFNTPVKSSSISFYTPEFIFFDFKSYNGYPEMVLQEAEDEEQGFNHYQATASDIPPIYEEPFSSYENSKMRVDFKFDYNRNNGSVKIFSWANAANSIYDEIYQLEKEETKALGKIVKNIDLEAIPDTKNKIFAIEDYLKNNFYLQDNYSADLSNLEFILKNKYANKKGMAKLIANTLKHFDIRHELILTSSRDGIKFDKDFETYSSLNEYLIHIPENDIYISPSAIELRYGLIPPDVFATYGLKVKDCKITDFYHPVGEVAYIPEYDYSHNYDNLYIEVEFDENFEKTHLDMRRDMKGYSAAYTKIAMKYLEEEKQKKLKEDMVKYIAQDADIKELVYENTDMTLKNAQEPLVLKSKFTSASFLERAGNDVIFNLGDIIGEQTELYQEKERQSDVENDFNRGYLRKVNVKIPDGYKIANPDDINLNFVVEENGKTIFKFVSSYVMEGGVLKVSIEEFYDQIYYPQEKFEDFREVINAAADFNKINLILRKI